MLALMLVASHADAATRTMTGTLSVINPSTQIPFLHESGPGGYGRGRGTKPPTTGPKTINVAGTAAGTSVGRQITIPAGRLNFNGRGFRDFPLFPQIAQVNKTYMSVQAAATFMNNGGALAACPGPGCNASGTAISWCQPSVHNPLAPAPGTAMAPIGNWNCPGWFNPGVNNRGNRIEISNITPRQRFGGTFTLLRNSNQNVWRVAIQPGTMGTLAIVERDVNVLANHAWTPGRNNFEYVGNPAQKGPRIRAQLNANGAIQSTFGCENGVGTVGPVFVQNGNPIVALGNNCGTNPVNAPEGQGWGFKLTTGTVQASDVFPFSRSTTAMAGTPFNPHLQANAPGVFGFIATRMGNDEVTAMGARNIVLIGGGLAFDPGSGNLFQRFTDLRMTLTVPEPAAAIGIFIGAGALAGLARRRR